MAHHGEELCCFIQDTAGGGVQGIHHQGAVGNSNNGPIIESILALRHEQAQLIGYPNFVEYSMASKVPRNIPTYIVPPVPRAKQPLTPPLLLPFADGYPEDRARVAGAASSGFI